MFEFLGDFGLYLIAAVLYGALAIGAFFGLKLAYYGWHKAKKMADNFRIALGPRGVSRQERVTRSFDVIHQLAAFLAIVSLISIHDSFLAWACVYGFTSAVLKIEEMLAKAGNRSTIIQMSRAS